MAPGAYQPEQTRFDNDSSLIKENIITLRTLLSKQGNAILKALYESPGMQQKSLAVSIHTSPASLSNIISKLETIQPELLKSERIGRSKYYALTDMAIAYVESELLSKEEPVTLKPKIHPFDSSSYEEMLTAETLHCLNLFQHTAGNEWFMVLDDLLSGITDATKMNDELYDRYKDFMESLTQLRIHQKNIAIRKVYDVIDNLILSKRLNQYLDKELKDLYVLEPLFDLGKQDFEQACTLIDYIFFELRPSIFGPADDLQDLQLEAFSITTEQYYAIHHQISNMINEFFTFGGNKTKAVTKWKDRFHSYDATLRYIVSNCFVIYTAEQKKY